MKIKTYPWLRQITLKQLRGFQALLDTGSISGAAKNLHLTPPAVSMQLRELEASIGIPLVEKKDRGLTATRVGKELNEMAEKIQVLMIEYCEKINELSGLDHGNVSIGMVSTARYFIPNLLVEFKKIHPSINLQLQVGNRELIVGKLESLELDFAIMGQPPEQFSVQSKTIGKHPQIIIAPTSHHLAKKKKISLAELKDESFLLREAGSGTRSVSDKLFKRSRIRPQSANEFGSNETIKQAVIAGMGIALISAHAVWVELDQKRLVALDVQGLPINRTWYIVKHKNKRLLHSSLALWDFIVKSGKDFLPS
jgi:DNA-binding transcriptional LysR family regulator